MRRLALTYLLISTAPVFAAATDVLIPYQYLQTSGAREITPFKISGNQYIAVPQLAKDIDGMPASMNGGNANVPVILYKWLNGKFTEYQQIPSHGNESAEFFTIQNRNFLAIASINSGSKPPFNFQTSSTVYEWDGKRFNQFQTFNAFASKSWKFFTFNGRYFLALANGLVPPNNKKPLDTSSTIYEWNGERFEKFQSFPTKWAYGWNFFTINGVHYLGLTDHAQASAIYRWDGNQFVLFQRFDKTGGRSFEYFMIDNKHYLAYANINHASVIYSWDGNKFVPYQTLEGLGGRNFTFFTYKNSSYLFRVNFITGPRTHPQTALASPLYRWVNNRFIVAQSIPSLGGVQAARFTVNNTSYIGLANSLNHDSRFRVDSVIYKIG